METTAFRASVLIVDDMPANLLAMGAVLKPLGTRILKAQSGNEALQLVQREPIAVALLDVQMPQMDGFQLADALRKLEQGKEIPIVFVTAIHRDEEYIRRGYTAGAADYITKPFDADVVRARVKAFVELFAQREKVRQVEVSERTRERDDAQSRLVAFERIATATVDTPNLDALLRELLATFLGATPTAESAAILLRDGEKLTMRAFSGANRDIYERLSLPSHRGFVARISAENKPLSIPKGSSWIGEKDGLQEREARALYGVPLLHNGEMLGIAYIGSPNIQEFAAADTRLFSAVCERAAWAVAKQLERSQLHEVLAAAPALISIVRVPSLDYSFAAPGYRALFGGRYLIGVRASEFGLGEAAVAMIQKAYTEEAVCGEEISCLLNGEQQFFQFTAQPLRNHAGAIDRVLTFATDVSPQVVARKRIEAHEAERMILLEKESAARAEAERASRAKDEFLAIMSHELRTPLNAILGWTAVLRKKGPTDLERALETIERNARAQARIIEDILDISRIVSGKMRLDFRPIDVSAVIQGVIDALRPAVDAKRVALEVAVQQSILVMGDPERLQQVFSNLLSNAIKFTPKGGSVSVRTIVTEQKVKILVTDTGQGIEPGFLPQIFEPFRQADGSSTRRHGGLGLGLAIVKRLVEVHGGQIHAASDGPGMGATFTIELPLRTDDGTIVAPALRNFGASRTYTRQLDQVKVLVVDDDIDARELLERVLGDQGAAVLTASSAPDGLIAIEHFHPAVVVSDLAMPGMDGYEFMRAIRSLPAERGGDVAGIALSAYGRAEDSNDALAAGFRSFLAKPVDVDRLLSEVSALAGVIESRGDNQS
jgi:signal transduction histidine kinase/DNA-binding response OmpR family regulator